MSLDRRTFIKTTGSAALAATLPLESFASLLQTNNSETKKPVVGVLYEPGFPEGEIPLFPNEVVNGTLKNFEVKFFNVVELKEQLRISNVDIFLNPYGSCFPKEAWGALIKFFKSGGSWINIGGVPLSIPVVHDGNSWRKEVRQVAYHKKVGITQSFPVSTDGTKIENRMKLELQPKQVYELYFRLTETRDFPDEDGPAGARDANVKALSYCLSNDGRKIAAPIIELEQLQGDYVGGRWILVNYEGAITPDSLRKLVERAAFGAIELTARMSFACYKEGETPSVTIQARCPKGEIKSILSQSCEIEILNEKNNILERTTVVLHGDGAIATGYSTLKRRSLSPGLYTVKIKQGIKRNGSSMTDVLTYVTGFWVYDQKLLEGGKSFTTNNTYLLRDNQPYPVTGTSYMGSDVHRKFLFEPNPLLWNNDFNEMKSAGINMVRTGIWTAWKNYMLDVGVPNEAAMRAMDAFLLTARKYDIPIIFTFFAFLPEMWGGENPYLDPRSINAQKEFITAFAQRYRNVNDIIWDFINEPSFCNPRQLWTCRPNYDEHEAKAWSNWLREKYPADTEENRNSKLQEIYRSTPDDALGLPALEEFADANIFNESRPIKVIDYRLFAQEMFVRWTKEMTKAIRSNGNPLQLITVGQDEGGTFERPSPQFYAEAVHFTCLHNWWFNDDLLWDSIITKSPAKPNLVEETGVMFYERMDGSAWRTEQEAANLLERKLALSLGAGGAGFIQWIWNTNPYMKSDNEAAIGLHRVDGTAKPELEPVVAYAKFFAKNKQLMTGRIEEEVVMVIPHSLMFSTRNYATEATRKCVRAMCYHCHIPMRAVSEYRLNEVISIPKLIIVPSPRILNQQCWETLLGFAEKGATVLVSGYVNDDEHWLPVPRLELFAITSKAQPVAQEELFSVANTSYRASYRGDKIQRVEKAVPNKENPSETILFPKGKGKIIWSPLPVELAEGVEPTIALYRYALEQASIVPSFSFEVEPDERLLVIPSVYENSELYTFISESSNDTAIQFTHARSKNITPIKVQAQKTVLLFLNKSNGKEIARIE